VIIHESNDFESVTMTRTSTRPRARGGGCKTHRARVTPARSDVECTSSDGFYSCLFVSSNRNKTLKPQKPQKHGKRKELSQFAQTTRATLGSGSMLHAVKLPKGEDVNEWLAVNTVDFFNELSMLYGTISEYCNKASCPVMQAGDSVKSVTRRPPSPR
jgi:hypothetical protein